MLTIPTPNNVSPIDDGSIIDPIEPGFVPGEIFDLDQASPDNFGNDFGDPNPPPPPSPTPTDFA